MILLACLIPELKASPLVLWICRRSGLPRRHVQSRQTATLAILILHSNRRGPLIGFSAGWGGACWPPASVRSCTRTCAPPLAKVRSKLIWFELCALFISRFIFMDLFARLGLRYAVIILSLVLIFWCSAALLLRHIGRCSLLIMNSLMSGFSNYDIAKHAAH